MLVTERAEARLNVQTDPERVQQPTAASTAPKAAAGELFPVYGYTDQVVMRDMRFKITEALAKAGLNQTAYGRQTIAALASNPTRPDAVATTIKLG